MSSDKPEPYPVAYVLYEKGLFVGFFEHKDAAERLRDARAKAGHGPHEIVTYRQEVQ